MNESEVIAFDMSPKGQVQVYLYKHGIRAT